MFWNLKRAGAIGCVVCLSTGASNPSKASPPVSAQANATMGASVNTGNPYLVIVRRNAFQLTPLPSSPPDSMQKDLPVVKLFGFANVVGQPIRAYFSIAVKDGNTPEHFSLVEGDHHGALELLKIHPDQEKVVIINTGTTQTLTLKDNGYLSPALRLNVGNPHVQ